jgi:hypothetical protein
MGKKIQLIGTCHKYQLRTAPVPLALAEDEFKSLLKNAIFHHAVQLVGEEMSLESLGTMQSICKDVSNELGIAHCYCDPDTSERAVLGIPDCNEDLVLSQILTRYSPDRRITREEAEKETAEIMRPCYAKREKEWLRRLETCDKYPALFICGTNHVTFFRDLAISRGFLVTILQDNWYPTSHVYPCNTGNL